MPKLESFNSLPDCAYVPDTTVAAILSCDRSTVWRKAKAGKFPAPIRLSDRLTRWRVGDVRKWLSQLHGEGAA